ncbi:hypothetical protein N9242_07715, partial [Vicingaceae bacterium]|nr:hypothetical protein [Vicingaceae bacterium]
MSANHVHPYIATFMGHSHCLMRWAIILIAMAVFTKEVSAQKEIERNGTSDRKALPSTGHTAAAAGKKGHTQNSQPDQDASNRAKLLEQYGANSILSKAEIAVLAKDQAKLEALLRIVSGGQLVGGSDESIENAKHKYLKNPTPEVLDDAMFDIVAESNDVPKDIARRAGIKNAEDILSLAADLQLIGDEDSGKRLSDPKTFETIKKRGRKGLMADVLIESQKLPPAARGLPLEQLLDGITNAQEHGADVSRGDYWKQIRDGAGRKGRANGNSKIDSQSRIHEKVKIRNPDQKQNGERRGSRKSNNSRGKSPFDGPGGAWATMPQVGGRTPKNREKQTQSSTAAARQNNQTTPNHNSESSPNGSGSSNGGTPGSFGGAAQMRGGINNTPPKQDSQHGGAINSQGDAPPPQQTGTGISASSGSPAGAGAVNTVLGAERDESGAVTYTWMRDGGNDGRDGIYQTTYRQDSDGSWSWEATNAVTGEVVGQGQDSPPD